MPNWASLLRLLRRRSVLGIIFALSLTYCTISLLSHEKLTNSLRRIRTQDDNMLDDNQDSPVADYNDNADDDMFDASSKNLAWELENYEAGNEDSADGVNPSSDSNGTVVVQMCRNSVQGKALIVDDKGYVCGRSEVLPTGCCSTTLGADKGSTETTREMQLKRQRFSCETCNPQGCCAVYEYCVSCCLHHGKRRVKEAKTDVDKERRDGSKMRRGEDAVKMRLRNLDRFQMCLATCRTSSASVRHENTYKDPDSKHCYTHYQRLRRDNVHMKNNNGDNAPVVVTSSSILLLLLPA